MDDQLFPGVPEPWRTNLISRLRERFPAGSPSQQVLADAEHRAYARGVVGGNPMLALPLLVAAPAWDVGKRVGVLDTRSKPSVDQVVEGWRGVLEGLGDRFSGGGVLAQAGGVHPRTGKPVLQNPDGSISTERTITVEMGGRHYVIPTIIGGKVFEPDAAVLMFKAGKNKPVGEFGSAAEADEFARRRSQELGR